MRLAYTYIRLDDGQRLIVPNERLAQSSVQNHTVVDPRVKVEIVGVAPAGGGRHARARAAERAGRGRGGARSARWTTRASP